MGDLYSVLLELSLSGQMEVEPREVKNMKIKAQIVFYLSSIRFGVFWFGCVGLTHHLKRVQVKVY